MFSCESASAAADHDPPSIALKSQTRKSKSTIKGIANSRMLLCSVYTEMHE